MAEDITNWNPDDKSEWESTGKAIANRNLWVSIPSLLSGFAVWLMWGIITVQMLNTGYGSFDKSQLFTLAAIAGLSGATLRIPSTFFIRLAGGRNTIFLTTSLLILPALGLGMALSTPDTPFWTFQVLALLSGFGGGNFASSMSNIFFFFPKRIQGYSLGMNAGLGNFGVTTMQIVIPLVMTLAVMGNPTELQIASGTLIGKIPAGTDTYLQNAGYVWLIILIPLAIASWLGMNNITEDHVSPKIGSTLGAFIKIIVMVLSALGVAYFMKQAYASATPEEFFWPFLILFVVLFAMTGLGNGSTFRTISQVFNKEQAGPVLGWTSAVAAYGAFIISKVFGEQIKLTTPENALYGFAVFYAVCMVINWWFYLRKNAEFHNP